MMFFWWPVFLWLSVMGKAPEAALPSPHSFLSETPPPGATVADRFAPPPGFRREYQEAGSFGAYLQELPLRPPGSLVHYYNGATKPAEGIYVAVVDMDIGKRDLQQCADAVMRLRAEWLYENQNYASIEFSFNNGFRAPYRRWRQGERIAVDGNAVRWYGATGFSDSYASFRKYLDMVFAFAGSLALERDMTPKPPASVSVGDVLIQGGSPGHVVIVVDKAVQPETGAISVILAQSYMPAQEIQILQRKGGPKGDPWYPWPEQGILDTPEWTFGVEDLRSFSP